MRNQFGGHAIPVPPRVATPPARATRPAGSAGQAGAGAGTGRKLAGVRRAPRPARLPLLRRGRRRARAGGDRLPRPQRPGQDQPRGGGRLPLPARLPPGRDGRTAGAGRRGPGGGPGGRRHATGDGGARGRAEPRPVQPGPGEPVAAAPARELLGLVRTVVFSPEDLTLVKGDPSDRRRFLDDLLVLRTPGWPASAPTTTGSCASATRCSRRRRGPPRRPAGDLGALDPRGVERPPGPHRRRAPRRPARAGRSAAALRRQGLRDRGPRRLARRRRDRVPAVVRSLPSW